MPNKRNPIATAERLLSAATRCFSDCGYDGASTEAIVAKARVNKRMLYHYYGDKRGLYRAVLERQWRLFEGRLGEATPSLEGLVDAAFDGLDKHPDFVRLMMWEGLQGGDAARSLWRQVRGPLAERTTLLLQHAFPAFEPRQLLVSLLGAVAFYFAYASTLGDLLGGDPLAPAQVQTRKRHVMELIGRLSA